MAVRAPAALHVWWPSMELNLAPRSEQVPSERYYPGQRIRVFVSEVHDTHRGPQIIVSRSADSLLAFCVTDTM